MKYLRRALFSLIIFSLILLDLAALDGIMSRNEQDYSGEYATLFVSVMVFFGLGLWFLYWSESRQILQKLN